jgi:hypothetical protein
MELLKQIREITKPVFKQLTQEVSDYSNPGPVFSFSPIRYSPQENEDLYSPIKKYSAKVSNKVFGN